MKNRKMRCFVWVDRYLDCNEQRWKDKVSVYCYVGVYDFYDVTVTITISAPCKFVTLIVVKSPSRMQNYTDFE